MCFWFQRAPFEIIWFLHRWKAQPFEFLSKLAGTIQNFERFENSVSWDFEKFESDRLDRLDI